MASFESIRPLLDKMSAEDLISSGEYISQQLEKQLAMSAPKTKEPIQDIDSVEENQTDSHTSVFLKPSPLLDLPRELRDIILSHAVQCPSPHSTPTFHDGSKVYPQTRLSPLLHTNRQLRSEAAQFFFAQHTFVLWGDSRFGRLASLLRISGSEWNKFVKRVVLIPDEHILREVPWEVYDEEWAGRQSLERRVEGKFEEGCVWTGMRRAGFGKGEVRYEVVGEGEGVREMVVA